eukprot:GFUD01032260.1.p1 GENE.GFUD01032260.1~~GFUD01032260.1.p1  ORF type:complete len:520 (+),score=131.72 GFUD01032260.1:239-1798(+)
MACIRSCYFGQSYRDRQWPAEDGETSGLLPDRDGLYSYTETLDRISETSEGSSQSSRTSSRLGREEGMVAPKTRLYRRRWYIIAAFSIFSLLQGAIFSSWSPIAASTIAAYPQWTEATISWQSNLALITSPLFQFPAWCLVAKIGVGPTVRWFAVLPLTICCMFRCLPLVCNISGETFTTITFLTSTCGGWASIIIFTTIGGLVSAWFPSGEQTLATGLAVVAINLGSIVSSLAGPAIVDDPVIMYPATTNSTGWTHSSTSPPWLDNSSTLRSQIGNFMFFHFLLALLVLVLVVPYFPSSPDIPPENAKSVPRLKPMEGLRVALSDKNIILLLLVNGLSSLPFMWMMSLMDVTLKPFGINEKVVGYLTSITIIVSGILTIATSRMNDRFPAKTKPILLTLLSLASLCSTILGFQTLGFVATSHTSLFISVVLSGSLLACGKPILLQAAAEVAYPVPEVVVTALMNQTTCLMTSTFLFLYSMSPLVAAWSPLCLLVAPLLAIFALTKVQFLGCAGAGECG